MNTSNYLRKNPPDRQAKKMSKSASVVVGGAERTQRNATKKRRQPRIINPLERQRLGLPLPSTGMHPFERFGAAFCHISPRDLVASVKDKEKQRTVLAQICSKMSIEAPTQPLQPHYVDPAIYFVKRAALVLEEVRCAVADSLDSQWSSKRGSGYGSSTSMRLTSSQEDNGVKCAKYNDYGNSRVCFTKDSSFTKEEKIHIRPGTVFQCVPMNSHKKLQDVILGFITTGSRETTNKFNITIFRDIPQDMSNQKFILTPITTVLTQLRCFEAMAVVPETIPFLNDLMGTRQQQMLTLKAVTPAAAKNNAPSVETDNKARALPILNTAQETAANAFLTSPKKTITLVQGPPGTGKTTLLVSVILQYLLKSKDKKQKYPLFVCTPGNKALSVLLTRVMRDLNKEKIKYNVLIVGDADKLLAEDSNNRDNPLRPIIVYSWLQAVNDDYCRIRNHFQRGGSSSATKHMHEVACCVEHRLANNVSDWYPELLKLAAKTTKKLGKIVSGEKGEDVVPILNQLIKQLNMIQKTVKHSNLWNRLIDNADVVFCTLASSGSTILKQHSASDLIVDEAAAATEPELCIPMHLKPDRMLCVGDPLQLPATVLSRRAKDLGLSESLLARLMFRCHYEYTMLDVQYRMRPEISQFPSQRFYKSIIKNAENVKCPNYGGKAKLLGGSPYKFLQVQGAEEQDSSGSCRNPAEARCVVNLILELQDAAKRSGQGTNSWYSSSEIRVITFYRAQVALLRSYLYNCGLADKVVVATVDSSQGCEASIVIVSFVRSKPHQGATGPYAAGFLNDDRRMNVALTRAKHQLICVGNAEGLSRMTGVDTLQKLAEDANNRSIVVSSSPADERKEPYRVNKKRKHKGNKCKHKDT